MSLWPFILSKALRFITKSTFVVDGNVAELSIDESCDVYMRDEFDMGIEDGVIDVEGVDTAAGKLAAADALPLNGTPPLAFFISSIYDR